MKTNMKENKQTWMKNNKHEWKTNKHRKTYDFEWLFEQLAEEFPEYLIPPLPDRSEKGKNKHEWMKNKHEWMNRIDGRKEYANAKKRYGSFFDSNNKQVKQTNTNKQTNMNELKTNRPVFRNSATMKMFLWAQKEDEFKNYQKQHRKNVIKPKKKYKHK